MPNRFFQFKGFTVHHDRCAMKVTTDACLFGGWVAREVHKFTNSQARLLDVGTGTGLLSLMVAQKNKAQIDAIEIDAACAEGAKDNVAASPFEERINIIHADLLQWQTDTKYDCIFSNPPFYQNSLQSPNDAKNVAHHDAGLKLDDLLFFIQHHLTNEGCFFLLLPSPREKELERLLTNSNLFLQQKITVQQTPKHSPFRIFVHGVPKKVDHFTEGLISIKNDDDEYTDTFVALLKDYYLYL